MTEYRTALTAIEGYVHDIGADLDVWVDRAVGEPDPRARRYAAEAVDAIDGALRELHEVRAVLAAEVRHYDEEAAGQQHAQRT